MCGRVESLPQEHAHPPSDAHITSILITNPRIRTDQFIFDLLRVVDDVRQPLDLSLFWPEFVSRNLSRTWAYGRTAQDFQGSMHSFFQRWYKNANEC